MTRGSQYLISHKVIDLQRHSYRLALGIPQRKATRMSVELDFPSLLGFAVAFAAYIAALHVWQ